MNTIYFTFIPNGQTVLGQKLFFSIELLPTRYMLSKNAKTEWPKGSTAYRVQGAN
jgi:hypothetical protein